MNKNMITVMAALGLTTSAWAGTPDEDWAALRAEQRAVSAQLDTVSLSGGPRVDHAITRAKALLDTECAIIWRGMNHCMADPVYDETHGAFWKQAWGLMLKTTDRVSELKYGASPAERLAQGGKINE